MSQPVTTQQIPDSERIAILDEVIAKLLASDRVDTRLEYREPFSAVVVIRPTPMTFWLHFGCLCLTLLSFGLGVVVWIFLIWASRPARTRQVRYDVTHTGQTIRTTLRSGV